MTDISITTERQVLHAIIIIWRQISGDDLWYSKLGMDPSVLRTFSVTNKADTMIFGKFSDQMMSKKNLQLAKYTKWYLNGFEIAGLNEGRLMPRLPAVN